MNKAVQKPAKTVILMDRYDSNDVHDTIRGPDFSEVTRDDRAHSGHTTVEVITMAKQGMKRPEYEDRKNNMIPVPQINGKARSGKEKAAPLMAGGMGKVWHDAPHAGNDLAVENLRDGFDLTAADAQDLEEL